MSEMRELADPSPMGDPQFDQADRMSKALRESGVKVQEMADYLGVSRNTVSTWINGRVRPKAYTVRQFALRTGVRYEWIRDGETAQHENDPTLLTGRYIQPYLRLLEGKGDGQPTLPSLVAVK